MSRRDPESILVSGQLLHSWPLPRAAEDKESRGRALVIGGSAETPGAVLLAAEAALRAGAGKLQVATVQSAAAALAVALPEALVRGLAETTGGAIAPAAVDDLLELATEADAVLVGPGMVDEGATIELLSSLVPHLQGAVVLDAMGLAYVTADLRNVEHLEGRVVLTPNRDELAIMLGVDRADVESDAGRLTIALAGRTQAVVSSGGAESWIAAPDGHSWRDPGGGSGLGVSGSGDVLAGVVTGLGARGAEPAQAAVWGSYLHKRAGERLAESVGEIGFLARELLPCIPIELDALGREAGRTAGFGYSPKTQA